MSTRSVRRRALPAIAAVVTVVVGSRGAPVRSASPARHRETGGVRSSLAGVPLRFEANVGQADARVRYVAHGRGVSLFLTAEGATFVGRGHGPAVTMRVAHAAATAPEIVADDPLEGRSNYLIGADPSRWHTGVRSFGRVTYRGVVRGVDQVFHGDAGALEYDLVVAPGVSPRSIELTFDGADALALGPDGALEIHAGAATLVQPKPRVLSRVNGREVEVAAGYCVTGPRTVAFDVAGYDRAEPLLIDPVLAYSTYLGGSGDDYAYGLAVDGAGAMYVTGQTSSTNFPSEGAYQGTYTGDDDAFITKLNSTGTALVYSTYLGGSQGTYGRAVAVDAAGAVYVVGSTDSVDFPAVHAFQPALAGQADGFAVKLSPDGASLEYSTYLGGVLNDYAYGVAVDTDGAAYVVGSTDGPDPSTGTGGFPVASAVQPAFGGVTDAFLTKLCPAGSALVYSTYLGGAMDDEGRGVAVDGSGGAYVTGSTSSVDYPTAPTGGVGDAAMPYQALNNGTQNAFVTKVSATGAALVYSTFLGGSEQDTAHAIAVDGSGAAYVTGVATSPDFPTQAAFQLGLGSVTGGSNAFITKLDSPGTALVYSTFLGGSGVDTGEAIAVSAAEQAFVTGSTTSSDFPTAHAIQSSYLAQANPNGSNAFVAALPAGGGGARSAGGDAGTGEAGVDGGEGLLYSTYLGGSAGDTAEAIAVGPAGAYVAGYTVSTDFPTIAPLQARLGGPDGTNAFVAVLSTRTLVPDAGPGDAATLPDAGDSGVNLGIFDAAEPVPDAGASLLSASGGGCTCRASGRRSRGDHRGLFAAVAVGLVVIGRRRRR